MKHHSDTHAWRGGDAPLRRTYRGKPHKMEKPTGAKKDDIVADRKGRQIKVERYGEKKPEPVVEERRGGKPRYKAQVGDRKAIARMTATRAATTNAATPGLRVPGSGVRSTAAPARVRRGRGRRNNRCASSADDCAAARLPRRSRRQSVRPRTGCAKRCSTF